MFYNSINNYDKIESFTANTTNKSDRELGNKFDINQFNKKCDNSNKIIEQEKQFIKSDDINKLPHKKSIEDIIISIKDVFYKIMELLFNRENPIEYILSTPDRYFAFSLLLIIIGGLLLLFSNILN
jgi:hypothetical protein